MQKKPGQKDREFSKPWSQAKTLRSKREPGRNIRQQKTRQTQQSM
jgi:hypothetical protein